MPQGDDEGVATWVQDKGGDLLFITLEGREEGNCQRLVIGEDVSQVGDGICEGRENCRALPAQDMGYVSWVHSATWQVAGT